MEYHRDECVILKTTWKSKPLEINYTLHAHQLEVVDHAIYLGIEIFNDLSQNHHVNKVKAKANRTLGLLR